MDARPRVKWPIRITKLNNDMGDFEKLIEEPQQCLLFKRDWKDVWAGWEAVVVMVPDVSVTFPSLSIAPDAITKHCSIDSVAF